MANNPAMLRVRLPDAQKQRLQEEAVRQGITTSAVVRKLIRSAIEETHK